MTDTITLTRSTDTIRDLVAALKDLGVGAGDEFVVTTPGHIGGSLEDAKAALREHLDEGMECPACGQFAKTYRRHVSGRMAADLILAVRRHGRGDFYVPDLLDHHPGDFAKLAHWGLISAQAGERPDGSTRTGWWRVTELGERFVRDEATIPYTVLIFDGVKQGQEGDRVSIHECLGKNFNYSALMAGE